MTSPKYYNYETDRIFCSIDLAEVERLFKATDKEILNSLISSTFTSYSGFISHYPNSLDRWPVDLSTWDHNQVGTLLSAFMLTEDYKLEECSLVNDENGFISNLFTYAEEDEL